VVVEGVSAETEAVSLSAPLVPTANDISRYVKYKQERKITYCSRSSLSRASSITSRAMRWSKTSKRARSPSIPTKINKQRENEIRTKKTIGRRSRGVEVDRQFWRTHRPCSSIRAHRPNQAAPPRSPRSTARAPTPHHLRASHAAVARVF
jgi:hypothetical protein